MQVTDWWIVLVSWPGYSILTRIGVSAWMPGYTVNFYPDIKLYPGSRAMFSFDTREHVSRDRRVQVLLWCSNILTKHTPDSLKWKSHFLCKSGICMVQTMPKSHCWWKNHNKRINVRSISTYQFGQRPHTRLIFSKTLGCHAINTPNIYKNIYIWSWITSISHILPLWERQSAWNPKI